MLFNFMEKMMERVTRMLARSGFAFLMVAVAALTAAPAAAAEAESGAESGAESEQEAPTVGLGLKLPVAGMTAPGGLGELGGVAGFWGATTTSTSTLLIPMRFGEDLRLEPHVSFALSQNSSSQQIGEVSGREANSDNWSVDAGAALHHLWSPFDATLGYVGLQAGFGYNKYTSEREDADGSTSESDSSTRSLFAGPVVGGEYKPTDTFGFGVEASLLFRYTTNSRNFPQQNDDEASHTGLRSQGSVFARVYLW